MTDISLLKNESGAAARTGAAAKRRLSWLSSDSPRWRAPVMAGSWFLLLALLLLRSAVFGGEYQSSTETLYLSAPFAAGAPNGWETDGNLLLSDVPWYFTPMLELVRDTFRSGHLPFWNPYIMSGAPLLGNAQSAVLSPINLLIWVLPLQLGLAFAAVTKLWLGGFGTYLLARRLGVTFWGALVAGTAFSFSAFEIAWLGHAHTNVTALLPWLLWAFERLLHDRDRRPIGVAAIVTGALALGGHPESVIIALFGLSIYVGCRLLSREFAGRRKQSLRRSVGALVLGGCIAAPALIPFLSELSGSADAAARLGRGGTLDGSALASVLFPDLWGRPTGVNLAGPSVWNERTFYAGTVALVLAVLGLFAGGVARRFAPFLVLGGVGLLGGSKASVLSDLLTDLPVTEQVVLARLHVLFGLGLAVLAGVGLDQLIHRRIQARRVNGVLLAFAALLCIALVAARPSVPQLADALMYFARPSSDPSVVKTAAVLWAAILVGLTAGLVVTSIRRPSLGWALAPLLVLAVGLDMFTFADGFQPSVPKARFYAPVPGSVKFLQRQPDAYRSTALFSALPPNVGQHFRLRDIRAKDFPKPIREVRLFKFLFNKNQTTFEALGVADTQGASARALGMMGVKWILSPTDSHRLDKATYRIVYYGNDAIVYENEWAVPRAFVPRKVEYLPGDAMLPRIDHGMLNPRRTAMIEAPPGTITGAKGTARIVSDEPNRVRIDAELDRPGYVVLSDSMNDGWSVRVDGRPAESVGANYLYRAVEVGTGKHQITWSYVPPGLWLALALSALGLAAVIGLLVGPRRWLRVPWRS